jgi:hypothetical protein
MWCIIEPLTIEVLLLNFLNFILCFVKACVAHTELKYSPRRPHPYRLATLACRVLICTIFSFCHWLVEVVYGCIASLNSKLGNITSQFSSVTVQVLSSMFIRFFYYSVWVCLGYPCSIEWDEAHSEFTKITLVNFIQGEVVFCRLPLFSLAGELLRVFVV